MNAVLLDADQVMVFGSQSGRCVGAVSYEEDTQTVVYDPPCAFEEGELVSVTVAGIVSLSGTVAPAYQWQFTPRVEYGTGAFEGPDEFDLGIGKDPVYLYAGDLDGDLMADLAVANSAAGTVSILINQRNRPQRFNQEVEIDVGIGPYNVTGGDLNADGEVDLIVSNLLENTLSVLINQGNAVFATSTVQTGERPLRVEAFDADNDGDQDLAVAAFGIDQVWVHLNNGDATFAPPQMYDVGASPAGMVARDWDNDGHIDLYVASLGDQQLNFLRNDGAGAFEPMVITQLNFSPAVLAANDLLGVLDGRFGDTMVDLVVSAQDARDIWVYRNDGVPGALQPAFTLPADSTSSQALGLVIADIDTTDAQALGLGKDFDLDIVSTHFTSGEVRPALNGAGAVFGSAVPASYPSALLAQEQSPTGIEAADFDGDGDIDLAVANSTTGKIAVFYNIGGRLGPIAVLPDELDFGQVCIDADSSQTILFRNAVNYPVTVSIGIRPNEGVYFPGAASLSLVPGELAFLPVNFMPVAVRDYAAELVLSSEVQSNACGDIEPAVIEQIIPLLGTGAATQLSVAPDTLDFGLVVVGEAGTQTATIDNQGNIAALINQYGLSDAVNFNVVSPLVPAEVGALSQQEIEVSFQPTVSGDYLETLNIFTTDRCGVDSLRVVLRASAIDPLPDLMPLDLAAAPGYDLSTLKIGDPLQLQVSLDNQFFAISDPFENQFTMTTPLGEVVPVGDVDLPNIGIETLTGLTSDTFTLDAVGDYTFCFDADINEAIEEQTDENNRVCAGPISVRPLLPDLVAADLFRTDGGTQPIRRSQQHDYTGVVQNEGELDVEQPFLVEIRINGVAVDGVVFNGLPAGGELSFTAPIDFFDAGLTTLSFFVDAGLEITEITEENNEFTLPEFEIEVPDALAVEPNPFTPNGDSFNDYIDFKVNEFGLFQPILRIFSFEGRLIRTDNEIVDGFLRWDGRDDTGRDQRPGVYLYTVEDDRQVVASGHITLAR